jgi:hypothetical protein
MANSDIPASRKTCTLGNKPNKYHRARNQYEGEKQPEIGNIAGQAKGRSIAFAELSIQTPARSSAGLYSAARG